MPKKFPILFPLMLGTLMSGIDSSIVNVSLPVMRKQFNVGLSDIEWVITVYMLGFCVFMPLVNWMKQRIGFYALYLGSLSLFIIGSLCCALSHSLPQLIASRGLQAFGGGAIAPTAMAILSTTFPKSERGNVMGWWALGSITGPAMGPTLGGILTHYFGWPSIFMVNIPIGIIAIAIAAISLRFLKQQANTKTDFDFRGFIFFSLFILLFQYGFVQMSKKGLSSLPTVLIILSALLSLFIFIRLNRNNDKALFDLQIFRHAIFVQSMIITFIRAIALYGGLFLLPFLLQGLLHYSEIQSGLMILPNSIAMAIMTPMAGTWSDKHGPKRIVVTGICLVALSMMLFSQAENPLTWYILIAMAIRGLGMGCLVSTITSTSLNAVLPSETTSASSMYTLVQQLGGSIGIAVSGVTHQFLYAFYSSKGDTAPLAEHHAIEDVFIISMFLVLLALIPGLMLPSGVQPQKNNAFNAASIH